MSKQAYIAEVDALRASPSLRAKLAALPEEQKMRCLRKAAPHGRWAVLAAALALVIGLGVAAPAILHAMTPDGGDITLPPPLATATPAIPACDPWGLHISVEDVTATGLTLVIERSEDATVELLDIDDGFWIERYENGQWSAVETLIPEAEIAWQQGISGFYAGGSSRDTVDWVWLYGALPDGVYRLGLKFSDHGSPEGLDSRVCYAEFTIGGEGTGQVIQGVPIDQIDYAELEARMDPGGLAALKDYFPVLREGARFRWVPEEGVTGGGGEDVTLEEYYDQRFGLDHPDGKLDLERLTLFGFEGDGKQDLVLCFLNGGGSYLILHREGADFYGFERGYRSFLALQQDGVYTASSGAAYHSYCRIQFKAGFYEEELLGQQIGESYEIGGIPVSEAYFTRWQRDLMAGDMEWYSLSPKIRSEIHDVVLPMTMAPGSEVPAGIAVERSITFDFNDAMPAGDLETGYPMTEDQYIFRNHTMEEKHLTLFYPFRGSLGMGASVEGDLIGIPTVTVDHGMSEYGFNAACLHAGEPLGTDDSAVTWETLSYALAGNDYINASVSQDHLSLQDLSVHAYAVTDMEGYETSNPSMKDPWGANLRVDLQLAAPEHTQVFTYGFDTYYGKSQFGFFRAGEEGMGTTHYIILVGGDLTGYTVSGWQDASWTEPLDGLTAKLTPLEKLTGDAMDTYFEHALGHCLTDYLAARDLPLVTSAPGVPTVELYNAVARYILSNCAGQPLLHALYGEELPPDAAPNLPDDYALSRRVEDILHDVLAAPRVLYYEGAITVPIGFTIVHATSYRRPSLSWESREDELENRNTTMSYDLAPTLGSLISTGPLSVTLRLAGRSVTNTNMGTPEQAWSLYRDWWRYNSLSLSETRYFFDVKEGGQP